MGDHSRQNESPPVWAQQRSANYTPSPLCCTPIPQDAKQLGSAFNQIAYGEVMQAAVRDYVKVRRFDALRRQGRFLCGVYSQLAAPMSLLLAVFQIAATVQLHETAVQLSFTIRTLSFPRLNRSLATKRRKPTASRERAPLMWTTCWTTQVRVRAVSRAAGWGWRLVAGAVDRATFATIAVHHPPQSVQARARATQTHTNRARAVACGPHRRHEAGGGEACGAGAQGARLL